MDPRLLGLGRGGKRLHLGERLLADVPPGRDWVPGDWQQVEGGWQLGRPASGPPEQPGRGASTCRRRRSRSSRPVDAGPGRGLRLRPRLLGLPGRPLRLAAGLLDAPPARLGVGAGLLQVDAGRLRLRRRLLGPRRCASAACCSPRCASPRRRTCGRGFVYRPRYVVQPDFLRLAVRPARARGLLLRRLLRGRATAASTSRGGLPRQPGDAST